MAIFNPAIFKSVARPEVLNDGTRLLPKLWFRKTRQKAVETILVNGDIS